MEAAKPVWRLLQWVNWSSKCGDKQTHSRSSGRQVSLLNEMRGLERERCLA